MRRSHLYRAFVIASAVVFPAPVACAQGTPALVYQADDAGLGALSFISALGDAVFFNNYVTTGPVVVGALWQSDGTTAGTGPVLDLPAPGGMSPNSPSSRR